MAGETTLTIIGNLTADPEIRFTQSGAAVADFTVASTSRTFDRATNEWKEAGTVFMRCSVWREAAENVAESLRKGMRVIVQGRLTQRSYETREGERRTVLELQVDEVGPSLRRAKAVVTRSQQTQTGQQGPQQGYQAQQHYPQQPQAYAQQQYGTSTAWETQNAAYTPQPGQQNDPWQQNNGEPPF